MPTALKQTPVKKTQNNTPMVSVKVDSTTVSTSDTFRRVLKQIPVIVAQAKQLENVDIDQLDEDQISSLTKKFRDVQHFANQIENSKRDMRRYFNGIRDSYTKQLDEYLNAASYDQLKSASNKIKQLKRDIRANRINKRWEQLFSTFEANINLYPIIITMAPKLANYDHFRTTHPKWVSGAKNKPVNDKLRSKLNNLMKQWATSLQRISDNTDQLMKPYQEELLKSFIEDPTVENLLAQTTRLQNKQQADLQAQQDAQNNPTMPVQTAPTTNSNTQEVSADTQYKWLIDYIFSKQQTKNIHTSNRAKANVLYDLYNSITKPNNIWSKHLNIKNPDKVIACTKYILNL